MFQPGMVLAPDQQMRSQCLQIFIILSAFFSSVGTASEPVKLSKEAMQVYRNHFFKYDTVNNMPWDCGGNAYDLFLQFKSKNLVRNGSAQVVHISYKEKDRFLIPSRPRAGHQQWAFHAFLVIDNVILDQYFTNRPQLVNFENYMAQMWANEDLEGLQFQIIPVDQYPAVIGRGYFPDPEIFPFYDLDQASEILE